MFSRALSLVVALAFLLGTTVAADPAGVSIQQQATLADFDVVVTVVVNRGDGPSAGELEVAVRQGDFAFSSGVVTFSSTGNRQEVTVLVPGFFVPGTASASAAMACANLLQGLSLGASIKIS